MNQMQKEVTAGTLDPSFGDNGVVDIVGDGNFPYSILALTDKKLIYAQYASAGVLELKRMNENGFFDSSFGDNGSRILRTGWSIAPRYSLFSYLGDKFLVKGTHLDSGGQQDILVARYDLNGQLDTEFGNDGIVNIDPHALLKFGKFQTSDTVKPERESAAKNISPAFNFIGGSVCVQQDGKILVAHSGISGYENDKWWFRGILIRLMRDGSLDKTFNGTGVLFIKLERLDSADNEAISIALQKDGKILVFGSYIDESSSTEILNGFVTRYNEAGQLDNSFNNGQPVIIADSGFLAIMAGAIAVEERNGAIVIAGSATKTPYGFGPQTAWIAVLSASGSFNLLFNNGQPLFSNISPETSTWRNCAWQEESNAIIVTGSVAARYLLTGLLDSSFNGKGWFDYKGSYLDMAVSQDQKLVLLGRTGNSFVLRCLM